MPTETLSSGEPIASTDPNVNGHLITAHANERKRLARRTLLVWENFGPMHLDRISCVVEALPERDVIGIQLGTNSSTYAWETSPPQKNVITLFPGSIHEVSLLRRILETARACLRSEVREIFLCNYEHPATFTVAILSRLLGKRVFVMNDSKFDDYPRFLWREFIKAMMYLPYQGAIASGIRSKQYLAFLGFAKRPVVGQYNSISNERVIAFAGGSVLTSTLNYELRHFLVVARLVQKKNIALAIKAFVKYRAGGGARSLKICGSGPLEAELRELAEAEGVQAYIEFHGFVQAPDVAKLMRDAVALILPSFEEQFGNVVLEAQSVGLPVIVSMNAGAIDQSVRTGVNGFVFEPDNEKGLSFFMTLISSDYQLWRSLVNGSAHFISYTAVREFGRGVRLLVLRD